MEDDPAHTHTHTRQNPPPPPPPPWPFTSFLPSVLDAFMHPPPPLKASVLESMETHCLIEFHSRPVDRTCKRHAESMHIDTCVPTMALSHSLAYHNNITTHQFEPWCCVMLCLRACAKRGKFSDPPLAEQTWWDYHHPCLAFRLGLGVVLESVYQFVCDSYILGCVCALLSFVQRALGQHPPPAQGKPPPPLSHRDGSNLRVGSLIVHELQPADSSRPSIFSPLSSAGYSHCASYTLGSLRAWQSPTAKPGFRRSKSSLRAKSGSIVMCRIIVALDNSERVGHAKCTR